MADTMLDVLDPKPERTPPKTPRGAVDSFFDPQLNQWIHVYQKKGESVAAALARVRMAHNIHE
jgi:hypothetical protein